MVLVARKLREQERLRSKALTSTPLPSLLNVPPQTNGTTDWEPSLSWPLVEISDPNHSARYFPPGFDFFITTTRVGYTNYLVFSLSCFSEYELSGSREFYMF